jgi:acetylornithine/succinyldiaminopimelate/putrescine aminotransferase
MTENIASALEPGDHGSTFAGGPVITGVALEVLERISQPEFLAHVQETGEYLLERLSEINSPLIKDVRGRGLIAAMELTVETAPIIAQGYQHGLILVNAGPSVIRFVPPLIVDKTHVDQLIDKLTIILAEAQSN